MRSELLDYREIPGQNALFLRYLHAYEEVREWYPGGAFDLDALIRRSRSLLSGRRYPREALTDRLEELNRDLGAGVATLENIRRLRDAGTVAVVTGQQVGLFGGPALTVYKAVSAIRLAQLLGEHGVPAVPVFWLASDDSDFEEVASTVLLDKEGALVRVKYPGTSDGRRMVGGIRLDEVTRPLAELSETVVDGSCRSDVLDHVRQYYGSGCTFRHAFGAWLAFVFRNHGLILHDALLPGLKPFLREAYSTGVRLRREIVQALKERSERLVQAGFQPQVQLGDEETLLFLFVSGRRYKLEFKGGRYRAKDGGLIEIGTDQALARIRENPEDFGPNVLFRPILQDHLFPTVAYVGGPAEVAYFSQINAMAPFWDLELAVVPRAGITIVDAKVQRLLAKYGLGIRDVIGAEPQATLGRLARDTAAGGLLERFEELDLTLGSSAAELRKGIESFDRTVSQLFENSERKMRYQLRKVKDRFIRNLATSASDLGRHVRFLHNSLYPEQNLQERILNFNHFLILQGPGIVDEIVKCVDPFSKKHQVMYVSTS